VEGCADLRGPPHEAAGPGTIYLGQGLKFLKPGSPGDTITATATVKERRPGKHVVLLDTVCTNNRGERVLAGAATVIAPEHTIELSQTRLPDVSLRRHDRYERFVKKARGMPAVRAVVVHPCSAAAIQAAIEVREEGSLEPLLIGQEAKIRAAAEEAQIALDGIAIESVVHSHAAAARAVELAAAGQVSVLVKGSLHADELLSTVLADGSELRTERWLSHIYAMDVPAYAKPVIVTDAAINIQLTLVRKGDIGQNAVDLLRKLGMDEPLVAILVAVETVNPNMPATLDAAARSIMAIRGQITGARVDGMLAFDNAISADAARTKDIVSCVAGRADILLVPDLEAGKMPAKQFIYFAGATAAGLMPGGRVPIVLTSRAPRRSPSSSSHSHAELDIHTPNRNRRRAFQPLTAMSMLNAKTTPKMNAIYDRVRLVAQNGGL
jgi:phosphate acetyltransferase